MPLLELPLDVFYDILDHITLPSDLNSLCLTCKDCFRLATPRLYSDVTLSLDRPDQIGSFVDFVSHEQYKGQRIPRRLTLLYHDPLGLFSKGFTLSPDRSLERTRRDNAICDILNHLPPNSLHTFQCLSLGPLKTPALRLLLRTQNLLQHLHVATEFLDLFDREPVVDPLCLSLRTLNLRTCNGEELPGFVQTLPVRMPKLERLHLGWAPGGRPGSLDQERTPDKIVGKQVKFANLRELGLNWVNVRNAYDSFAACIDFARLQKLMILGCTSGEAFLLKVGDDLKATEPELDHLAMAWRYPETCESPRGLAQIYSSCKKLRTLHLEWQLYPSQFFREFL